MLLKIYRHFGGNYSFRLHVLFYHKDGDKIFIRNVDKFIPDCTVPHLTLR
jgi:hypothetical protein